MNKFSISVVNVDISVIIVSFNTSELLRKCIRSVLAQTECGSIEIIVVDNHSGDGSPEMIETVFPNIHLIRNTANSGFSSANNQGLAVASGHHVFFLNPDTELLPDCLHQLKSHLDRNPDTGAVGPRTFIDESLSLEVCSLKLLTPERAAILFTRLPFPGRRRILETIWNLDLNLWRATTAVSVEGIGGAGFYMRRPFAVQLEGMDERFFMGYEDTDLSARVRASGLNVCILPSARMIHWFGQSKKLPSAPSARIYDWHAAPLSYLTKHSGFLSASAFRFAKALNVLIPRPPDFDGQNTIHPNPTDDKVVVEWPMSAAGPFLFELSNTPCFYDKFAQVTTGNAVTIHRSLFVRLATPQWYFRVVALQEPSWNRTLMSGRINAS